LFHLKQTMRREKAQGIGIPISRGVFAQDVQAVGFTGQTMDGDPAGHLKQCMRCLNAHDATEGDHERVGGAIR